MTVAIGWLRVVLRNRRAIFSGANNDRLPDNRFCSSVNSNETSNSAAGSAQAESNGGVGTRLAMNRMTASYRRQRCKAMRKHRAVHVLQVASRHRQLLWYHGGVTSMIRQPRRSYTLTSSRVRPYGSRDIRGRGRRRACFPDGDQRYRDDATASRGDRAQRDRSSRVS